MEKIQCPECGRVKDEKDEHCLDCGYVFKKDSEEKIVKEETIETTSKDINYLTYIIVGLNIIYLLALFKIPMIVSHNSGNLPLFEFLRQYFSMYQGYVLYKISLAVVIGFLIINLSLYFINNKTKRIAKILYFLVLPVEVLFVLAVYEVHYSVIMANTIFIFIIPLALFILVKKDKLEKNSKSSYVKKIKELKELYDSKAISKEEFEKYKKEILDKEMK